MFEPLPELSSDLEWMLESGQASAEMLADALVTEFYTPVYRLGLALLDDPSAAEQAAFDTLVTALASTYRYRSQDGPKVWVFQIALDSMRRQERRLRAQRGLRAALPGPAPGGTYGASLPSSERDAVLWLAVDGLKARQRLSLLLRAVLGWEAREVRAVLKVTDEQARTLLRSARWAVLQSLHREGFSDPALAAESLDDLLEHSLQSRWPGQPLSQEEHQQVVEVILHAARQRGQLARRFVSIKEISLTGLAILAFLGFIWLANRFLPEADPTAATQPAAAAVRSTSTVRSTSEKTPTSSRLRPRGSIPSTATPTTFPDELFYTVKAGDTLESIAALLGASVQELVELNRLPSPDLILVGQRLLVPVRQEDLPPLPRPTRVSPPLEFEAPGDPPQGTQEILQFIEQRRRFGSTFWVDAYTLEYGPPGYIGPPRVNRLQAWNSQDHILLLYGSPGGAPEEVILGSPGNEVYRARPAENQVWFVPVKNPASQITQSPAYLNGAYLFEATRWPGGDLLGLSMQVTGQETTLGRDTWVVEQKNQDGLLEGRLWVDNRTGMILRRQFFASPGSQVIQREFQVTRIDFNIDFPYQLFDPRLPWRGGFALDYSGAPIPPDLPLPVWEPAAGHERRTQEKAPSGFDPSSHPLAVQLPPSSPTGMVFVEADLFAGSYHLGSVDLGNPWSMICQRSPDGQKIAYVSQPYASQPNAAWLLLFDLSNLEQGVKSPMGRIYVTHFAFAPDSRRLAVFGYDGQFSMGAIYVLDTETGVYRPVIHQGDAKSMVWSPDGEFLAYIGRGSDSTFDDEVIVMRVDTADVVYRSQIDTESNAVGDWPMLEWGLEEIGQTFPVEMSSLGDCLQAPFDPAGSSQQP